MSIKPLYLDMPSTCGLFSLSETTLQKMIRENLFPRPRVLSAKRIRCRKYDEVSITKGYPARNDAERHMMFPYRGYTVKTITHEFFGPEPVEVFAIKVGAA